MGTVYSASHPELGSDLALKVLGTGAKASDAQRARFQREVRALKALRHPGLVEILDAGEQAGIPWLAMRRIEGGTLGEKLQREGPLSPNAAIELGIQLCSALSVAHGQGILHRDLKPDNVLCAPDGRYVVTDFGLTKDLTREASLQLSQTGALQGTPGYWAPEQASGRGKEATFATDVYGVGAVLYAALTGVPPLTAEGLLELSVATIKRAPVPPSSLAAVPPPLERVVLRCLAKSSEDRYVALAEAERPPLPLPAGVEFGAEPREYLNRRDASILVWVPPGSFAMGSETGQEDERPVHLVTFKEGYFIGKLEVTWQQYEAFCEASARAKPSRKVDARLIGGIEFVAQDTHPAFNVSWDDAVAYP